MELGLKGKVAIVTGGASGIGRAITLALANENVNIVVADINRTNARVVIKEAKKSGIEALALKADVTKMKDIKKMVDATVKKFGRVDILVNNAGTGRFGDLLTFPESEFRYNMDLMFFGVIRACQEVVPYMRKAGWGRIINISSAFGKQPGGLVDYDSIKAALIIYTKDLSNYLAKDNILVNAVCPGPIHTPLWDADGGLGTQLGEMTGKSAQAAIKSYAEEAVPLGHFGQPEDVAAMVTFLASEKAKFITGQAINVDGGLVKTAT